MKYIKLTKIIRHKIPLDENVHSVLYMYDCYVK